MLRTTFRNYARNSWLIFVIAAILYVFAAIVIGFVFLRFRVLLVRSGNPELDSIVDVVYRAYEPVGVMGLLTGGLGQVLQNLIFGLRETGFEISLGSIITILVFAAIGILVAAEAAAIATRVVIKRRYKNKKTRGFLIAFPVKILLDLVFVALLAVAMYFFTLSFVPFVIVFALLSTVQVFLEAKIIYLKDKKLKEIFAPRNIGGYIAGSGILFLATIGIFLILMLLNFWVALIVCVPLFVYLLEVVRFAPVAHFGVDKEGKEIRG